MARNHFTEKALQTRNAWASRGHHWIPATMQKKLSDHTQEHVSASEVSSTMAFAKLEQAISMDTYILEAGRGATDPLRPP